MIPKKIHYCWFGGKPLPAAAKKYIASWRKFCPDYEIIEWNEQNFDLSQHPYLEWCHQQGKWAFLSDFARLLIVEKEGGIYFDTDVEVVASFDKAIEHGAFYGFENDQHVASGLGFGAEPGHPTVVAMSALYKQMQPKADGSFELIGCPILNTQALEGMGLKLNGRFQHIGDAVIYPQSVLNPYDYVHAQLHKQSDTLAIHWYSMSWLPWHAQLRVKLLSPIRGLFKSLRKH